MNPFIPKQWPGNESLDGDPLQDFILLTLDTEFRVANINKTGCKLLGYSAEEVIGKDWFEHFVPQEEGRRFKSLCSRLLDINPERLERFENAVLTSSGNLRIIKWQNSLHRNKAGKLTSIFSVGIDVTARHKPDGNLVREEREKRKLALSSALDAQEKERRMIAENLHENVLQMLTTCKLLLESQTDSNTQPVISKANSYLQKVINEIRSVSHWLNPTQIAEIGLEAAIREMISELTPSGIPAITLHVNDSTALNKLHPDVQLSLFRIVQEQLSNIAKHAQATKATILIHLTQDHVEMEIKDNGKGFNPKKTEFGLGLCNIESRAENYSGTMCLETAPGEGCTLSICLPLDTL